MAGARATPVFVVLVIILSMLNGIVELKASKIIDGLLSSASIKEAAIEKGIEVAGKMIDKQLKIIDEAQDKAESFLDTGVKIDIVPQKGWARDDMFVPPGYHIGAQFTGGSSAPPENGQTSYTYEGGIGNTLMNGCYGSSYSEEDPCHGIKRFATICTNMIDGAAFIGVGFDGRGSYSAESRKMSIVQRQCSKGQTYDRFTVPDTMNVHGIFDTIASMTTFESRQEYQQFLQTEAGVSGSYFGFYGGVKGAYGESQLSNRQTYMSVLDVDVYRYEIFMDEVRPEDLSLSFLKEFMNLPTSYFTPGSPIKYQNFIQRFGTHYIKSAEFGGRLEIRKTMDGEDVADKKAFSVEMEAEYKGLFASAGAYSKTEGGSSGRNQTKSTSTSITVNGGSQEIASILADAYSPTFKDEFKNWLKSIPHYPKAFRFLMGPITDLVNFRADDLFPGEPPQWACAGMASSLQTEVTQDGRERYYYINATDPNNPNRVYCKFNSRKSLEDAISRRRSGLKRAIDVYLEEGPISTSDFVLEGCSPQRDIVLQDDVLEENEAPSWSFMTEKKLPFNVVFDMQEDLLGASHIPKDMSRTVRFAHNKWFISDENGGFRLYNSFANGYSGNPQNRKVSINGLVLTYWDKGHLVLDQYDYNVSKSAYPNLNPYLIGLPLARVGWAVSEKQISKRQSPSVAVMPCSGLWSNALRVDPTVTRGICLHFTASTSGDLYVVFATIPGRRETWYSVRIGTEEVSIIKGEEEVATTDETAALAMGDKLLHQSYFVCVAETRISTALEYGKSSGSEDAGEIYLSHVDTDDPLNVRFYGFGNRDDDVRVMDAHIVSRNLTNAMCRGDTYRDDVTRMCLQRCHSLCDPLAGCKDADPDNDPEPTKCNACRYAEDISRDPSECVRECPENTSPIADKTCKETFSLKVTEGSTDFKVENLPHMRTMSVCLWIQLAVATTDFKQERGSSFTWPMSFMAFQHKDAHNSYGYYNMRFMFEYFPSGLQDNGEEDASHELKGYFRIAQHSQTFGFTHRQYNFNALGVVDGGWHHTCVTWSGLNGGVHVYFDGNDLPLLEPDSLAAQGYLRGGGIINAGSIYDDYVPDYYNITELNVWDHVLLPSEISEYKQGCFKATGNVREWNDFKPTIEAHSANFLLPSRCPVSVGANPTEDGDGDEEVTRRDNNLPRRRNGTRAHQPSKVAQNDAKQASKTM